MKKLLCCAMAICILTFSSCALFGEGKHEHVFGEEWATTGGKHYKICAINGCTEQSQAENHQFENGKCKVCGYNQQSISPTE